MLKSYTYDGAGNTQTVTSGTQVTTLNWDSAGMLSGIVYPNGTTNTFTYNGLKQRVGKTDSTGTFSYTLADDSIDAPVLSDGVGVYRHGLGLLGETKAGAKRYYNADALGSTRAITDDAGTVDATHETDAFGNTVAQAGKQTPFGFAGQHGYQTDADSGLQKLGYRYYDSSTGRFLSKDPIQDGYNWYAYCNNDPLNAIDPKGLRVSDWIVQLGTGAAMILAGVAIPSLPGLGLGGGAVVVSAEAAVAVPATGIFVAVVAVVAVAAGGVLIGDVIGNGIADSMDGVGVHEIPAGPINYPTSYVDADPSNEFDNSLGWD